MGLLPLLGNPAYTTGWMETSLQKVFIDLGKWLECVCSERCMLLLYIMRVQ